MMNSLLIKKKFKNCVSLMLMKKELSFADIKKENYVSKTLF